MGWIQPPRVLNAAPGIYRQPPPPHPSSGWGGGNQAAADDCLPLHPRTGPLVQKFEGPWVRAWANIVEGGWDRIFHGWGTMEEEEEGFGVREQLSKQGTSKTCKEEAETRQLGRRRGR